MYKIWNIFKKGRGVHVIIACNKLLEKVLVILNLGSLERKGKNTKTEYFKNEKSF